MIIKKIIEWYTDRLGSGKIRLKDVPEWLRMDHRYTRLIHIYAFRADQGISRKQFEEDLDYLEIEIILASASGDKKLQAILEWIREYEGQCVDLVREERE